MKVLLVNYYYKPMVDAHAYRWAQLAEYWAAEGYEVEVICSRVSGEPVDETLSNVTVDRVGFISATKIQSKGGSTATTSGVVRKFVTVAKNIVRVVYRKLYWPDGLWHWYFSVMLELMKRRLSNYDLIVSYSPSFTAHLAVLLFKKLSAGKFYWIADYGDPFSTSFTMPNNNVRLFNRLNRYVESLVIKAADKVCFTSQNTYADYCASFGTMDNAVVIPHLADVNKVYLETADSSRPSSITLVFIGNFHIDIREPFLAAQIIKQLENCLIGDNTDSLAFDIYGASNGVNVSAICDTVIRWHGPLDRGRVNEVIGNADFLVNIENTNCSMIPSKIVEYIATGKPIINVAKNTQDVSPLLASYAAQGCAFVITENFAPKIDDLKAFIRKYKGVGKIARPKIDAFLADYGIEAVSGRYLANMNEASR